MKVYISREILHSGIQLLQLAGHTVTQWTDKRLLSPEELIAQCQQQDALLCAGPYQLDATFFEACSHLKVVALHSVGYDNVDLEAAKRYGVPVGNTPGVLSAATADTAFLLMLATSRKAFYRSRQVAAGAWHTKGPNDHLGIELRGKTLGIFGLGQIGFELATRCRDAFKMEIIYHNRSVNAKAEAELGARLVSFEELLQQSDVLSLHAALTPETTGLFNAAAFQRMKPTAIFINTARGGMHNERDLIHALEKGVIWGAGLDVTNPEPMLPDNPLLDMPNVSVLPHIGSATIETRTAMVRLAAANIIAGLKGEPLPYGIPHE